MRESFLTITPLIITIDGPSGVGKGSVSSELSRRISAPVLNSGAIYRILGSLAHRRDIAPSNTAGLTELCNELNRELKLVWDESSGSRFFFDGQDMAEIVALEESGKYASVYGAVPEVRAALINLQRRAISDRGIAEGRDMGTVVFPEATHKFFLTASPDERARRRFRQLYASDPVPGESRYEALLTALKERDARDTERTASPTRPAEDAHVLDSTTLSLEEVVAVIMASIS